MRSSQSVTNQREYATKVKNNKETEGKKNKVTDVKNDNSFDVQKNNASKVEASMTIEIEHVQKKIAADVEASMTQENARRKSQRTMKPMSITIENVRSKSKTAMGPASKRQWKSGMSNVSLKLQWDWGRDVNAEVNAWPNWNKQCKEGQKQKFKQCLSVYEKKVWASAVDINIAAEV